MSALDGVSVEDMLAEIQRRAEADCGVVSRAEKSPPDELAQAWLDSLTLSGYRPATLRFRQFALAAFAKTIHPRPLSQATVLDATAYLARPLSAESRRAYRSTLRCFYQWCAEEGHIPADPTSTIRPIRVPRAVPRPISGADLSRAVEAAGPRMRAWLLCMALAGLRCCEVAVLRPEDLTQAGDGSWLLYLRETKGGGSATMPAHPEIVEALRALPIRSDGLWWSVGRTASVDAGGGVPAVSRRGGYGSQVAPLRGDQLVCGVRA